MKHIHWRRYMKSRILECYGSVTICNFRRWRLSRYIIGNYGQHPCLKSNLWFSGKTWLNHVRSYSTNVIGRNRYDVAYQWYLNEGNDYEATGLSTRRVEGVQRKRRFSTRVQKDAQIFYEDLHRDTCAQRLVSYFRWSISIPVTAPTFNN